MEHAVCTGSNQPRRCRSVFGRSLGTWDHRRSCFAAVQAAGEGEIFVNVNNYILGSAAVHDRFRTMTDILGKLVSSVPHPVSITQLEQHTGRPAVELLKLCRSLSRATLLLPHDTMPATWQLACAPSAVTLEDVFRCVTADPLPRGKQDSQPEQEKRAHHNLDLLLMQATMSINQSISKHLRQFSLDRLHLGAHDMLPFTAYSMRSARSDNAADIAAATFS